METIQAQITLDNAKAIQELQRLNQTITNSFQSLSKTLGDSLGKVDGKTAGQKIANDISSEGKKAGVSFGDLFKSSLLASLASSGIQAAIGGIFGNLKESIDLSSDAERSGVVLGVMAEKLNLSREKAKQLAETLGKDLKIGIGASSEGIQNLVKSGLNLDQVNDLMRRFNNEAITGKSSTIDQATAVKNLTFAYMTGNSALGNMSGISENFQDIEKKGLGILQKKGELLGLTVGQLDQAQSMQARYAGIIDLTNLTLGSSDKLQGTYGDNLAVLDSRFTQLKLSAGQALTSGLNPLLTSLVSLTQNIDFTSFGQMVSNSIDFITNNFTLLTSILAGFSAGGVALGVISSFTAISGAITAFGIAAAAAGGITSMAFFPITAAVVAIGLAVAGLALAWQTNFGNIQIITQTVISQISNLAPSFGILALAIGGVVAIFVGFPTILSIASASIPIFTAGLAMIPTAIGFVISSIAFIGTAIMGIWPIIFGIGPMIMSMIPAFFTLAGAIFSSIIPTIMAVATTIFTSLIPAIFSIIPSLFATIGGFIMWAGAAIMSAGATLLAMLPVILTIGLIAAVVGLLFKAWSGNWMGIKDITASIIGGIIPFLQTAFKFILDVVAGTMKAILSVITSILGFVVNVVADSLAVVTGFFFDGFFAMEDIVTGFMDVLAGLFSGDLSKVVQGFGKVFAGIIGLAAAPVKAVVKAVESGLNLIIDMINGVTQNDVVKGVLEKFGMKVGKMNPLDFAKDFDKKVTDAQAGAVGIGGETAQKEYEKKASERAGQKEAAMSAIKDGAKAVTGAMDGANSAIQGAIDSANSALKNAPSELAKGLQGLGQSIADNIGKLNPMEEMQKKQQEMQDKMKADQEKMKSDQDKMKADMDKQKADAEANLQKAQSSQPKGAGGGGGGGKSEAEKQADEAKKLAEQKAKDEANAQKEIEKLKVANIKNDTDRQKASLDLQAKNDLENFKGSESQKAEFAKLQAENVAKEKAEIDKKLAEQSQKEAEKTQKEQIQQQKEVAKTGEQYDNLIGRLSTLNQKQQEYTDKTKESTKIADSQKIADIRDQLAKLGTANFGQMGIMNDGTAPTPAKTPTTPINRGQVILSNEQPQAQNQPPADPSTLTQPIDDTAKKTSEGIDTLIEKIKTGISGAIAEGSKAIIEEITKMDEEVVKIFNLVNEGWITIAQAIGQNVITGIISGLQKGERSIYSAIASLETSALRAVNIEVKSREEFGDEKGRGAALGVPSVMNPNVEFMRGFKPYSAGSQTNNQAQNNQKTANFGDININNNTDFDVFKGQLNGIFVG